MSTSLLYHAFGLKGYKYLSTEFVKGTIMYHTEPAPDLIICPIWYAKKRLYISWCESNPSIDYSGGSERREISAGGHRP